VVPSGEAEPRLGAGAGPSADLRGAAREHRYRVSRARAAVAGDSDASETHRGGGEARWETGPRAEAAIGAAEVDAAEQPPVAKGRPSLEAAAREEAGSDRDATVVDLALRFALNASPFGLHRATLQARQRRKNNQIQNQKRGDF